MKYENQIFNLSAKAYAKTEVNNNEDEEILQIQSSLLKILLKKFEEELNNKKTINQGILKVQIKQPFFVNPDPGYGEISKLLNSNNFDSFASQYCIYLGNVVSGCNERHGASYEIIWDYKTYFEQLSMQQNKKSKQIKKMINN